MLFTGNKRKAIAALGISAALVLGAGTTAFGARPLPLTSAVLTATVSTASVKPAGQKLGLDGATASGSEDGAGASRSDRAVSSKSLVKATSRELPKHSVSEADELERNGRGLDEKLKEGKTVNAEKYLSTHEGLSWESTTASTYGEGDGLMGSSCSDGSEVTETSMGVAHKTIGLGSRVQIMYAGKIVEAVVRDRGPFVEGRDLDLQPAVRKALGFSGVGDVKYRVVD